MRTIRPNKAWWLLAACLSWNVSTTVLATGTDSWLISEELLDHARLTRIWQATLPVKEGESLDSLVVLGGRLYVRSSENYAWSLDRNDGRVIFGQSVATPGFPLLGWTWYEDRLISVIDNQVIEFDKESGLRKRVSDFELSIVAPPVRNSRFFYVSGADRRLHALRAQDMVQVFEVSARSKAAITSVLADEDIVVFGTDAGNLIAMMADAPRKLWQFDAARAMAGPVVRDGDSYYFANKDTNVYRVDAAGPGAATLAWKYQTEAVLDRPPRVTAAVVYQYALGRGLTAIDKQSGQALWFLAEGVDLLAEARGKAYIMTKFNSLAVMDNRSGKRLLEVNAASVAGHAANTTDAMIYIADERGRIACLRPAP